MVEKSTASQSERRQRRMEKVGRKEGKKKPSKDTIKNDSSKNTIQKSTK